MPIRVVSEARKQRNADLCARIQAGDKAAEAELIAENDGLVRWIASRYATSAAVDIEDYAQVGHMALLRAARHFDLTRETSFASYAARSIKRVCARVSMSCLYAVKFPEWATLQPNEERLWRPVDLEAIFKLAVDPPEHITVDIQAIMKAAELTGREKTVIRLLYGVGISRCWKTGEVTRRLGISRQQLAKIRSLALRKMAAVAQAGSEQERVAALEQVMAEWREDRNMASKLEGA